MKKMVFIKLVLTTSLQTLGNAASAAEGGTDRQSQPQFYKFYCLLPCFGLSEKPSLGN
jgi:hypothetical protein